MRKKTTIGLLLGVFWVLLACCSTPVKYYASDACLILKGQTLKKDILALFGEPNGIEKKPDDSEIWYYHNVKEGYLEKLPYVGKKMEKIPYLGENLAKKERETIKIEFKGDLVSTCCYTVTDTEKVK